jgi:hypothetical protein
MQLVDQRPGSLLSRIGDYYEDAEFDSSELGALAEELSALLAQCNADERLGSLLRSLLRLTEFAKQEQRSLVVLAD